MLQVESYKLFVGFITYGDASFKYLPFFLESLDNQSFKDFSIIAFDNSENDNRNSDFLIDEYPRLKLIKSEKNIGFSRAYNKMIAVAEKSGAEYFMALNPDIVLDVDAISKMMKVMQEDKNIASLSPRIMSWDFENKKKTKIIDTCGIKLGKGLRFSDLGQGEESLDEKKINIIGPSGAAALYRIDALKKVSENNLFFDEKMFMYKEDCDLAYRLFLSGFKSRCVFDAIVYHDRTAKIIKGLNILKERQSKSKKVREWSFLNQHIIYLKYWNKQKLTSKIIILYDVLKMFLFVLFFERFLLRQYKILLRIRR